MVQLVAVALGHLRNLRGALPRKGEWLWAVVPAASYFLGAQLAFEVGTISDLFAPLWPPNVILLCALTLAPVRLWWRRLATTLPVHALAETMAGMHTLPWLGAFACNVALAVGGAVAIEKSGRRTAWLGSLAKSWTSSSLRSLFRAPLPLPLPLPACSAIPKWAASISPFAGSSPTSLES